MQRRRLLQNLTLGATGAIALQQTAQAQINSAVTPASSTEIKWRMATSWPRRNNIIFSAIKMFCEKVATMTAGQFIITPYEAGEIVSALEVFSVVQSGEVDCGHTTSGYYLDQAPALVFGTSLPFGLMPYQQYAWLYYGGGLEAIQSIYNDLGLVALMAGSPGVQMGGWFNKTVDTVDDLKGLKMRLPGFGARVMEQLGAEPVLLGVNDIATALDEGQIDAAEWQNPHGDEQLRLYEVARYYYYPGWWEPSTTYEILINQEQWQQLPTAYQRILQAAASEMNLTILAEFDAANGRALQNLIFRGVELRPFSQDILEAAHTATFELLEETAGEDLSFQQLYQQWRQFRRQIFQWNQINELSFNRFSLQADES
ncbi:TRAP transporter substrate-binding protein DctP [Oscillatoria sp. CS-180]|uniref:TRAP transporter substrate-binding protein n=1 Tax=Oscillatoria sp. CS-180 TaxID=3021720 RepID=UPI00232FF543|nr:TRAP transporter substrate-binding protein DctP [Oscillatoria sp. CS-180]MDB9527518.1 TRAP transporter substrate-binding protein DctP [Oscillatoria sp. CS-180]